MDARKTPQIVYLDTHIVVWLYAGLKEKLSSKAREIIDNGHLHISPLIELELEYLREIGRIRTKPSQIISTLGSDIGLQTGNIPLQDVVKQACKMHWTRDPFDRLIVGETAAAGALLVTRDRTILRNFTHAFW